MKLASPSGLLIALVSAACGILQRELPANSPELRPFYTAMEASPRLELGFTPVAVDAQILLEGRAAAYDAMLHIYGPTSRTIAFRKTGDGYLWIGEQEIYTGPRTYSTPDGVLNEQVRITYHVTRVSGYPTGRVNVDYRGPDVSLHQNRELSVKDVAPLLKTWLSRRKTAA